MTRGERAEDRSPESERGSTNGAHTWEGLAETSREREKNLCDVTKYERRQGRVVHSFDERKRSSGGVGDERERTGYHTTARMARERAEAK